MNVRIFNLGLNNPEYKFRMKLFSDIRWRVIKKVKKHFTGEIDIEYIDDGNGVHKIICDGIKVGYFEVTK